MDAPDASGAESLAPQTAVEICDYLLRQVGESHTSDAGNDVAVDQVAVPTLGVAVPFVSVSGKPLVAPLAIGTAPLFPWLPHWSTAAMSMCLPSENPAT